MIAKHHFLFVMVALNLVSGTSAMGATSKPEENQNIVSGVTVFKIGRDLCDVASPIEYKSRIPVPDSRLKYKKCQDDVFNALPKDFIVKSDLSKSHLYNVVLKVCKENSDGVADRELACFKAARKMLGFDKRAIELKACKDASCFETALRCEKDFPFLKIHVRGREESIASKILTSGATRGEAFSEWSEFALLEVNESTSKSATQCLKQTYEIFHGRSARHGEVRDSVRMLLEQIRADFPETITRATSIDSSIEGSTSRATTR